MAAHLDSGESPFSDRAIVLRLDATLAAFGLDREMFAVSCDLDAATVERAFNADEESLVAVCGAALQRFKISSDWLLFGDDSAMQHHPAFRMLLATMPDGSSGRVYTS